MPLGPPLFPLDPKIHYALFNPKQFIENKFYSVTFMHPNHSLIHETGQNYPSSPSISVQKPVLSQKIPEGSP
jgi:hypothetical protein